MCSMMITRTKSKKSTLLNFMSRIIETLLCLDEQCTVKHTMAMCSRILWECIELELSSLDFIALCVCVRAYLVLVFVYASVFFFIYSTAFVYTCVYFFSLSRCCVYIFSRNIEVARLFVLSALSLFEWFFLYVCSYFFLIHNFA